MKSIRKIKKTASNNQFTVYPHLYPPTAPKVLPLSRGSERGFTIIEVALVLAIGALIFLVIFLAIPALQRNQRDDARKRDVTNVATSVQAYLSNNPGGRITSDRTVYNRDSTYTTGIGAYFDMNALSTNTPGITVHGFDPANPDKWKIDHVGWYGSSGSEIGSGNWVDVMFGKQCDGNENYTRGSANQAIVVIALESGSRGSNIKHACVSI